MRGAAGGARGASAVARHLPPRPVEPIVEPVQEDWSATDRRLGRSSVPPRQKRPPRAQLPVTVL